MIMKRVEGKQVVGFHQLSTRKEALLTKAIEARNTQAAKELKQDTSSHLLKAFQDAVAKGKENKDLTVEDLISWAHLASNAKIEENDQIPAKLQTLIKSLNSSLREFYLNDGTEVAILLGDFYKEFVDLQPFSKDSEIVAKIVTNYLAARIGIPLIIFPSNEPVELALARYFMAQKIQEAIYSDEGEICIKSHEFGSTSSYKGVVSHEEILQEWHELHSQMKQWAK
jgi:hypothetical protein